MTELPHEQTVREHYRKWAEVVDGMFYFGAAGTPEQWAASNAAYAKVLREGGKVSMCSYSPMYWGAAQPNRRYFETCGGEGRELQWKSIIQQQPDWVETVTWNDFNESYVCPVAAPNSSDSGRSPKAVPSYLKSRSSHAGYLELSRYYIQWYKSGKPPPLKDALFYFYPIGRKPASMAAEWTAETFRQVAQSRPLWQVPQLHNWANYAKTPEDRAKGRTPTLAEKRSMAWQCICEGATGLVFYSWFDVRRNPDVPFDTQWAVLKQITCRPCLAGHSRRGWKIRFAPPFQHQEIFHHPKNKFDVGNRLALWALARDYGKQGLVYSGPLYKSMKVEGNKIRLSFTHVVVGLKSRDGKPLTEFEIAGADGKFVPAEATIDGNNILVQAKDVALPTQVRLGWRNKANPNLINKDEIEPAVPRTFPWTESGPWTPAGSAAPFMCQTATASEKGVCAAPRRPTPTSSIAATVIGRK